MKINLQGIFNGNSGYSVLSRGLAKLMDFAGIDVRIEDIQNQRIRGFERLQRKPRKGRFNILHQIPTVNPYSKGFYTVTEFDEPTYGSISILRNAELLLTESNFCKEVFEEFTDAPVHVINYPLDETLGPDLPSLDLGEIEKFDFKFLGVFEWVMRKNPYMLLRAFVDEFDKDEDVCLLLRTWTKYQSPKKWIGKIARDHNVFLLDQVDYMGHLYNSVDAYITTTLGEGFGHTIVEAMACGLPVIAPNSSAIKEYINPRNAIPIDVKEKEIGQTESFQIGGNRLDRPHHPFGLVKPWFTCWEPDYDMIRVAMRRVYEENTNQIEKNAVKIKEKYNYDNTVNQIKEVFK